MAAAHKAARRGRPRDDTLATRRREEILETATRLFAERGFRNTDVEHIATAAEMGKGTVYRYFPGKRALFLSAVDLGMQRLQAALEAVMPNDGEPIGDLRARMHASMEAHLSFFHRNPDVVELLIQERAEFKDRRQPSFVAYVNRNKGRWRRMGEALRAQGRLRNIPVQEVHEFFTQLVYGTMFVNYFRGHPQSIPAQVRRIVDIVLYGVLSETERRRSAAAGRGR